MFLKKYGDIIVSIFFMAVSVALIIMAKALPKSAVMEVGPDFMPVAVGSITFALAALLLVISIKALKNNEKAVEEAAAENLDYKRVLMSFIIILTYVFVLQPIGFIISTVVYLPMQIMILAPGEQRSVKFLIQMCVLSVAFTAVVFFLFRYGFKIVLPAGIFTINL